MHTDDDSDGQNDSVKTPTDDDTKHQQSQPPSVTGEEDTMSGDMPAEPADIDEELNKVGLPNDENGIQPLGEASEVADEEE